MTLETLRMGLFVVMVGGPMRNTHGTNGVKRFIHRGWLEDELGIHDALVA